MKKTKRLIDFENHFMGQAQLDMFAARAAAPRYDKNTGLFYMAEGSPGLPMISGMFAIEERVAAMDAAGIDMAIISGNPLVEQMDIAGSIEAARIANDEMYALEKKFPGRFKSFAMLPVYDAEAAKKELRRCKEEMGFTGWLTFSNSGKISADGDEMLPIMAEAQKLDMCVYIHPAHSKFDRLYGCGSGLASAGLGFTIDAAVCIMRMITRGLFDNLPELKVIFGHLGEALPFTMDRMDRTIGGEGNSGAGANKHVPSYYFKNNLWVTSGGNFAPEAFECAKKVLGAERILFSTDYPFESATESVETFNAWEMTDEEREMIAHGNGEKFFGV